MNVLDFQIFSTDFRSHKRSSFHTFPAYFLNFPYLFPYISITERWSFGSISCEILHMEIYSVRPLRVIMHNIACTLYALLLATTRMKSTKVQNPRRILRIKHINARLLVAMWRYYPVSCRCHACWPHWGKAEPAIRPSRTILQDTLNGRLLIIYAAISRAAPQVYKYACALSDRR